jgi:hypothetical protein
VFIPFFGIATHLATGFGKALPFQRLFSEWAGTSPKKFLQFISVHRMGRFVVTLGVFFPSSGFGIKIF